MRRERPALWWSPDTPSGPPTHQSESEEGNGREEGDLGESKADNQAELASGHKKTRIVHYGDPDYYDRLPPHLQYLKDLPLANGAFDFYPPSFEIDLGDNPDNEADELDASKSPSKPSEE